MEFTLEVKLIQDDATVFEDTITVQDGSLEVLQPILNQAVISLHNKLIKAVEGLS